MASTVWSNHKESGYAKMARMSGFAPSKERSIQIVRKLLNQTNGTNPDTQVFINYNVNPETELFNQTEISNILLSLEYKIQTETEEEQQTEQKNR